MEMKFNYYTSPALRVKDYLDELEEQDFSNIRAALRKMGSFLSERGISLSAKEIKQQSRIEIKGVASNGKERLLQQEIKEKYGVDLLEESTGYNTLFPVFTEGTIMCKTDVIHVLLKGSEQEKQFINWYEGLRRQSEKIEILNENNFNEYNWTSELDAFHSLKYQRISSEEVRERIDALSDEELKYRLTLWLAKNPTDKYEDIGIDALKDYIM